MVEVNPEAVNIGPGLNVFHTGAVVLRYRHQAGGAEWQDVEDVVPLTWTPCHFGGRRPWFVCPSCGQRRGVLYGGKLFRCRKCYGLTYAGNNEDESGRLFRKRDRLHARLGGGPGIHAPDRPRYMHHRTYWKLRDAAHDAEMRALQTALRSIRGW